MALRLASDCILYHVVKNQGLYLYHSSHDTSSVQNKKNILHNLYNIQTS